MPSQIRDNTALSRLELDAGGVTAFMNYRLAGSVMTLDHTETPVAARGRGLASRLVAGVLETARARGLKVVPRCPFVRAYLAKHPEFRDIVLQAHLG
jgi:predicted GNAT family acetyltransferase